MSMDVNANQISTDDLFKQLEQAGADGVITDGERAQLEANFARMAELDRGALLAGLQEALSAQGAPRGGEALMQALSDTPPTVQAAPAAVAANAGGAAGGTATASGAQDLEAIMGTVSRNPESLAKALDGYKALPEARQAFVMHGLEEKASAWAHQLEGMSGGIAKTMVEAMHHQLEQLISTLKSGHASEPAQASRA